MNKNEKILIDILKGKANWAQIKEELSQYNVHDNVTNQKTTIAGTLFELFCKYYFKISPFEKDNYKNIWLYNEIPVPIRQKLNLSPIDYGVDLLLEDCSGEYFAIQCKFRNDESSKLNWSSDKIANLFGSCPNANGFIVFTNASDLDNFSKTRHDNFTFYNISNLLELDEITIRNILQALSNEKLVAHEYLLPRKHQEDAIKACVESFEKESRGQLILPCGAGKTLTALWIKERLDSKNTLVLVPSLALLRQIKNDWSKQKKSNYQYLCVCSENDIDKDAQDSIVAHTYEIGGRVTTDAMEIWRFLQTNGEKVIFSTYQSLVVIISAIENKDYQFEFIFCDEAHKTAGIGKSIFGLVHDNIKLPAQRRLYATATPRIVKDSIKKKLGDDLQYAYDMSDPNVFGDEFYRMTFKDAIEKDILVDYKIIAIGVNDKELQEFISTRRYINNKTSIDEIANNYALQFVMEKYNANHALTFHSRIKYAQEFCERQTFLFPNVNSFSVSGEQTTSARSIILSEFKHADKAVVSNARCLTEGVDIPAIDLVYFCDPKNSKVDIVQAVGRALRKKEGKKIGYVVVPIYHSEKNTLENSISQGAFKNLIQVVRSLCDQDERLQDEINFLAFGKGKANTKRIDLITTGFNEEFETINLIGFEEKLRKSLFQQIVEKTSNNWDLGFLQFQDWLNDKKEYPSKVDNAELYVWVSQQRIKRNNNTLPTSQIKKLDSINFVWDLQDHKWDFMYNILLEYRLNNEFEPHHESSKELYTWYITQKNALKNNKLQEERKYKFEQVTFNGNSNTKKWLSQYQQLIEYRKTNVESWPSSNKQKPDSLESKLHIFCQIVRKMYRDNNLSEFWLNKFLLLNFNFGGKEDNWLIYYNEIKILIENKNSISKTDIGQKASSWINRYWNYYNERGSIQRKLTLSQRRLIKELDLSRFFESWNNSLFKVELWIEQNGNIPTRHSNKGLNSWLYSQRSRYKAGNLSDQQITEMNRIGFDLEGLGIEKDKKRWIEQFDSLIKFKKNNVDKWPSFYGKGDEKTLYNWCQAQRQAQAGTHSGGRRKHLDEWQVEKMNSINFKWSLAEKNEEFWNNNFQEIKFLKENNLLEKLRHTENGKPNKLYSWLNNQKNAFKQNVLSSEKAEKLEAMGIDLAQKGKITSGSKGRERLKVSLESIKNFILENSAFPKSSKTNKDENNLYNIMVKAKRNAEKGNLTDEELTLIRSIGFWP